MAIIYSYPTINPELQDLLLGTEIAAVAGEDAPRTRTFTVSSVVDLAIATFTADSSVLYAPKASPIFTGTVTSTGPLTSSSLIKTGGLVSQFLMANGTIATVGTGLSLTSSVLTGVTNLTMSQDSVSFSVISNTGTDAVIPLGNGTLAGATLNNFTTAEKTKLAGIATGATVGVIANASITPGTNTKITYDAKGLVTSGTFSTTADIVDSLNKRYITDAQQTILNNTSGTNTGDQNLQTVTNNGSTTTSNITALSFTKTGGTASQFLKANGSVDESLYKKIIVRDTSYNFGGGATSPVLIGAVLVPANSFVIGDYIDFRTYVNKTNANAGGSLTISLNTVNSLTGALQIATYSFNSNLVGVSLSRYWFVDGATIRGYYNSASSIDGVGPIETTYIGSGAPFTPSNSIWFIISIVFDLANEGYIYRGTRITN